MENIEKDQFPAFNRLSPRKKIFFKAYIKSGLNATEAYRIMNPSAKDSTCWANGYKMAHSQEIKDAIAEITSAEITKDWVLRMAQGIALSARDSTKVNALNLLADLQGFIKPKNTEQHVTIVQDSVSSIRDRMSNRLNPVIDTDNTLPKPLIPNDLDNGSK